MTTTKEPHRTSHGKLSMAEILEVFAATGRHPLKFTAYDGSIAGNEDAELGLDLRSPRGATYLATAPGELGLARAYVSGDLQAYGVHPGDPYQLLKTLTDRVEFKRPRCGCWPTSCGRWGSSGCCRLRRPRRRRCQGGGASPTG